MANAGNAKDRTYPEKSITKPQISTKVILEEVSDGLKWVSERAFAFTAIFVAIAGWIWLDFLVVNKLPVSFFSSSMLAALPAFLGATIFVAALVAYMLLLPSFILNAPITADGTSLVDLQRRSIRRSSNEGTAKRVAGPSRLKRVLFKKRKWGISFIRCYRALKASFNGILRCLRKTGAGVVRKVKQITIKSVRLWLAIHAIKVVRKPIQWIWKLLSVRRFRRRFLKHFFKITLWLPLWLWRLPANAGVRWFITTLVVGLSWAVSVPLLSMYEVRYTSLYSLSLAMLSALVGSLYLCRGVKKPKFSFRVQAFFALTIQSYVAILILDIAVHQMLTASYWEYLKATGYTMVALYFVAIAQLIWSTIRARMRFYKGIVKDCITVATCVLTLVAMVPALAGRLASYPIMVSSSGARSCSVLVLRPEKPDGVDKRIDPAVTAMQNPTGVVSSRALSQIVQFDGMYYVKRRGDLNEKVFQIPRDAVSTIEACQDNLLSIRPDTRRSEKSTAPSAAKKVAANGQNAAPN